MNNALLAQLESLPDPQLRLDLIGERYSNGNRFLDGIPPSEVAELLGVEYFNDGVRAWIYSKELTRPTTEEWLREECAEDIVSLLREDRIGPDRLAELERRAVCIAETKNKSSASDFAQLGLIDAEVASALEGADQRTLEGDGGWRHVATLVLTAKNRWMAQFEIVYDDSDQDVSFEMIPPLSAL